MVVAVWVVIALVAVWAAVRVAGLERGVLMVRLLAFTPYVAAGALVPLVASVLTGQWAACVVGAAAVVVLAAGVLPRTFGSSSTVAGVPVRVMALNLLLGEADAAAVVELVRERRVDVLAVQEYTAAARDALAAAGIDALLPHQQLSPQSRASGSGLYSRLPLRGARVAVNPGGASHQAVAVVSAPGARPVEVHSVHPDPPGPGTGWAAGLRAQVPAAAGRPLRILAGDFNATLDHVELRRLLATGYYDAADRVGRGLTPTWPYFGRRTRVVPKVTIDHVLVDRGIGVRDFEAVTMARTDHRAILTTLIVPDYP
jgi:endonuclease/exonuclease/phosphatase (EEP) superfamily protein YafD